MTISIVPTEAFEEPKVTESRKKVKAIRKKAIEDKRSAKALKDIMSNPETRKALERFLDEPDYDKLIEDAERKEIEEKGMGTVDGVPTYGANKGGMIKKYSYGGRVAKSSAEKS